MAPFTSPHHAGSSSLVFPKDKEGRMIIQPRDLNIVWGKDNRYWNVPSSGSTAVELCQVSWLEVTGSVDHTNPSKNYDVEFEISFTQDAFGWGNYPIYIMVKRGKEGKFAWKKYALDSNAQGKLHISGTLMKAEKSGAGAGSSAAKLYFGMYEVWSGKWKGGLKIHQVCIREFP